MAAETTFPRTQGNYEEDPIMVVCVGLPGSGKSRFCYDLFEEEDASSTWEVVCQDTLGSRKRCEEVTKEALTSGRRVVVDRTNLSVEQREHWLKLAQEHWPFENKGILCLYFDTPYDECVRRCKTQEDHPTVRPEDAEKVVGCQAATWEPPSLEEGFSAIVTVRPGDVEFYRDTVKKLGKALKVERSIQEAMLGVS